MMDEIDGCAESWVYIMGFINAISQWRVLLHSAPYLFPLHHIVQYLLAAAQHIVHPTSPSLLSTFPLPNQPMISLATRLPHILALQKLLPQRSLHIEILLPLALDPRTLFVTDHACVHCLSQLLACGWAGGWCAGDGCGCAGQWKVEGG